MNKQHLINFEQSNALEAIGCPQKSEIYWGYFNITTPPQEVLMDGKDKELYKGGVFYSAYNLSELIEVLGDKFFSICECSDFDSRGKYKTTSIPNSETEINEYGDNPISSIVNLILKLHQEGILTFNKKKDEKD